MSDGPAPVDAWRERLAASRSALLSALEGVTEREFAAAFDGERSLVRVLAELAHEERAAVAAVHGTGGVGGVPDKPLAPQVIHDLAGARYATGRLIAEAEPTDDADVAGRAGAPADLGRLASLVDGIATREHAVAERIAARLRE